MPNFSKQKIPGLQVSLNSLCAFKTYSNPSKFFLSLILNFQPFFCVFHRFFGDFSKFSVFQILNKPSNRLKIKFPLKNHQKIVEIRKIQIFHQKSPISLQTWPFRSNLLSSPPHLVYVVNIQNPCLRLSKSNALSSLEPVEKCAKRLQITIGNDLFLTFRPYFVRFL